MMPEDLQKLTVSRLRALCKEQGISGYSKLTKPLLIQKLVDGRQRPAHPPPLAAASKPIVEPTSGTRNSETCDSVIASGQISESVIVSSAALSMPAPSSTNPTLSDHVSPPSTSSAVLTNPDEDLCLSTIALRSHNLLPASSSNPSVLSTRIYASRTDTDVEPTVKKISRPAQETDSVKPRKKAAGVRFEVSGSASRSNSPGAVSKPADEVYTRADLRTARTFKPLAAVNINICSPPMDSDAVCSFGGSYLDVPETTLAAVQHAYKSSFLSRLFGDNLPISDGLAKVLESREHIVIVFRFLATRAWNAVSQVGVLAEGSIRLLLTDLQPADPLHEVWTISLNENDSDTTCWVLAATCEALGRQDDTGKSPSLALTAGEFVRADWAAFLKVDKTDARHLVERLHWANREEFDRGISYLWRKRAIAEGKVGAEKLAVAERYVLAHAVDNGISGEWSTATDMIANWAGRTSTLRPGPSSRRSPLVNFYLPEHHHVESVHFISASKRHLHPAIAIVQTPAHAYWVLRINGLPVGCESDEGGVAEVWRSLLNCTADGTRAM